MRTKTLAVLGIFSTLLFQACKDENATTVVADPGAYSVNVSGKIVTVKNLPADTIIGIGAMGPYGVGKYTFFNLATNSIVANSDSATANWDLAFAGTTIRVNNVTSGPGNGGAFVYNGTFDALNAVPADSTFRVDNAPTSYAIPKGSGKGWYNYDGPNNLVTAIPGRVLVIKTATGKYAKVEIINYYKGGTTPSSTASDSTKSYTTRFYHLRYTHQADGSMNF
jgi:hypothetical protein